MAAEAAVLKRRAGERAPGGTVLRAYERRDAIASLAMGTGSLFAPALTRPLATQLRPKKGKHGRTALAVAATAAIITQAADVIERRTERPALKRAARRVAAVTGPVTIATAGAITAATITGNTSNQKLFAHRLVRDLGTGPLAWFVAVAGWDFVYYWNHRFMHEWRHMWAIHVVHHSSEHYNLSTALRQTWTDALGTFIPYGMGLFGVRPEMVMNARGINLIYQYWIHTELIGHLGWAEKVLNTASHHRVHHGANKRYIDKNYGSILIVWDRLFGTFEPEDVTEPVVYGLTKNINTFNPLRIATHEFVDILRDVSASQTWTDRVRFAVSSPGWAYERKQQSTAAVHARPA
jgi:sterol desaturase/sphingolipid hydroxylase (fatty acid hydroxylase superfamily)